MSTVDVTSDRTVGAALERFARHARARYPVVAVYLYGSRARGDGTRDSDVDVALILDETGEDRLPALKRELAELAFDILLETGVYIQHVAIARRHWSSPETFSNPALIQNIRREGRPI
jgi:predicted nucleotidyltransferase